MQVGFSAEVYWTPRTLAVTGHLLPYAGVVLHGQLPQKAEYCSETHLKESSFQSEDLSGAAGLSLRRDHRHTVAWVRGVLGAPPP